MKKILLLIIFLLITGLLIGCGGGGGSDSSDSSNGNNNEENNVSIKTTGNTAIKLYVDNVVTSNAEICLAQQYTKITDSNGKVYYNDYNSGRYHIKVTVNNKTYQSKANVIFINKDTTTYYKIYITSNKGLSFDKVTESEFNSSDTTSDDNDDINDDDNNDNPTKIFFGDSSEKPITKYTIKVGEIESFLVYTNNGLFVPYYDLEFSSSLPQNVTINSYGTITGVKQGMSYISAKHKSTGLTARCLITVKK